MYLIRILIVGDSGVGKTSLLTRFYEGVDYRAKQIQVDDEMVKLQVWDTAGQERFRSMTSAFYNKAQGVILAFDVGKAHSFQSIPSWIRDIRRDAPSDCEIVLCANKTDIPESNWEVTREEFNIFAAENGLSVMESSACTGTNVDNIFTFIAREVLAHERSQLVQLQESENAESVVVFDVPTKKNKSGACC